MDLRVQKRTIELLYYLLMQKNEEAARIAFTPGKLLLAQDMPESTRLERSTPEAEGVSSRYIQRFLEALARDPQTHVHSCMVLRHGRVIMEGAFAPYRNDLWHVTHSLCKSLTGMAIGLLIDEGKLELDEKLVDIFGEQVSARSLLRQSGITVRHLLTMTSGVVYNEAASVTEEHWVKGFLESAVRGVPGEAFQYNSMNSYMLSAIVKRISGQSLLEYLRPRLLEPMGIRRIYWECCPEGIEKGGWGLYITPEDMAKLGQLMLQKGSWQNRQLISSEWVEQAVLKQVETPPELTPYGYGYQIWMGKEPGSYQFNGMLGQNVMIFPRTDLVVVNTAGSMELDARNRIAERIEEFFGEGFEPQDQALPEDLPAYRELRMMEERLGEAYRPRAALMARRKIRTQKSRRSDRNALAAGLGALNGHVYRTEKPAAALMPVFMQTMQNNFVPGIQEMAFSWEDDAFYVTMGSEGETYRLRIGFGRGAQQKLRIRGEVYWISVSGEFVENEDRIPVLKLRICFLECANERHIKIFLQPDRIRTQWSEIPGAEMVLNALDVVAGSGGGLVNTLISRMDPGFFVYKLQKTLSPKTDFSVVQ